MYRTMNLFELGVKFLTSITDKKDHYVISFNKESDNKWYCDIPNWPGTHHQTMMVAGSDKLLDCFNDGSNRVTLDVYTVNKAPEDYIKLSKTYSTLTGGADYDVLDHPELPPHLWICPVTLFVLGQYPDNLYIKHIETVY